MPRDRVGVRLKNHTEVLIFQSRICIKALQIRLIAEQNLIFCSRFLSLTLRNGGKYAG